MDAGFGWEGFKVVVGFYPTDFYVCRYWHGALPSVGLRSKTRVQGLRPHV